MKKEQHAENLFMTAWLQILIKSRKCQISNFPERGYNSHNPLNMQETQTHGPKNPCSYMTFPV